MRWTPSKILKVSGLSLMGLTPFVVAFLLLPSGDEEPSTTGSELPANTSIPLEFPFSTPSPSPSPEPTLSPTSSPRPPQCADGIDNDGDGKIDLADPGCSSRRDNSESPDPSPKPSPSTTPSPSPPPEVLPQDCADDMDNDGDGLIDGEDPGCADDGNELPFNEPRAGPPEGPPTNPSPTTPPSTTVTTMPPTSTTAADPSTTTTSEPQ